MKSLPTGRGERSVAPQRHSPLPDRSQSVFRAARRATLPTLIALLVAAGAQGQPVCASSSSWCTDLTARCGTNGCAGNAGDYYDNRDDGHTALPGLEEHPQLTAISTGFGGQFEAWDSSTLAGKVVVGNASVAYVSATQWGSVARVAFMLSPFDALRGYGHYAHNIAYWHPCHLDHPESRDFYHAMHPAMHNSQGSSRSELLEVKKWLIALAAFRPVVKQRLRDAGLLMPTLQMIARRARVGSDAEYLTGDAHPSVFAQTADFESMLQMANDITPETLPPFAKIRVLSDNYGGGNPFIYDADGSNRRIYDTPVSIARIFKDHDFTKWLVVTAEDSLDLNGRPLTHHWSVLRGDPARVRIIPQNPRASVVRIEIDYQPEPTVGSRQSSMVAVGAFVHNGAYHSAPAIVTSVMTGQDRQYESGTGRLLRIDYVDEYRVHPRVAHRKAWASDAFVYEPRNPGGWLRDDGGGSVSEFTRSGLYAAQYDAANNILQVQDVQYTLQSLGDHEKNVWTPIGPPFPYDPIAPTAAFTSPPGGPVSGAVTVSANAQDKVAVTAVSFWVGEIFLRSFAGPPYSFSWNTASVSDGPHALRVVAQDRNRNVAESTLGVVVRNNAAAGQAFYTTLPCRAVDTRTNDAPALAAGASRSFVLAGFCGIPPSARTISANLTVTGSTVGGHVSLQPAGLPAPQTSTINYPAGRTRANNAILTLGLDGAMSAVCVQPSGSAHLIVDVTGYFE